MQISNSDSKTDQSMGKASIRFSVISLFPEMFQAIRQEGVVSRAIKSNIVSLDCINPRDFTKDKHRTVDDRPYGGGPGMLMTVEPLEKAILAAKVPAQIDENLDEKSDCQGTNKKPKVIYLSPQGKKLDHQLAKQLTEESHLILVSGRYEGVDQRLIDQQVDMEISLGDFVLSGGELAAMAIIDAVTRLLPSVLGHSESAIEDSYVDGLLDHPHYTRPEDYLGRKVPPVLLSGDHQAIANWRLQQRLGMTWLKRPDLLMLKKLSDNEKVLLEAFKRAYKR